MTGVCFCLNAAHFGFSPSKTARMAWACSTEHAGTVQRLYGKDDAMAAMEAQALERAGTAGGLYLEDIGNAKLGDAAKLKFFDLSPEQYATLIKTVIDAYRDEMTRLCEPF